MTDERPAPPGYYPDSNGAMRWWDGSQWTDRIQPAAPVAAAAPGGTDRDWYKKKRFVIPMALLVLVIGAAAMSGGEDGSTTAGNAGSTGESAEEDEAADGDSGPGSEGSPVAVGETFSLKGTSYTVESAETAATLGDQFFEETAGGVYVVVELTIENTRDETRTFLADSAKFIGSNGKSYSTDSDGTFAAIGSDGEALIFEEMQPDLAKTGLLVFDVPEELAAGGTLEVSDLFGRGEGYMKLGL